MSAKQLTFSVTETTHLVDTECRGSGLTDDVDDVDVAARSGPHVVAQGQ